ncbi:MAG: hypothetical protein E7376_02285 [Clostridiales bacterium]|nr:hypothetical protein [Clostridiales bacterium]
MPKLIKNDELMNIKMNDNYEIAFNFNSEHCVNAQTKIVIVGTITPPAGCGYFYTSPANKIYGYIDEALKQTTLKNLKKELFVSKNKQEVVNKIKNELVNKNIAFLDIMKSVIRKKGSAYDNDIKYYSLDINGFASVPKNALVICNSRLAEFGYLQICEILNIKPNYLYLAQRGHTTKQEWLNVLIKHLLN